MTCRDCVCIDLVCVGSDTQMACENFLAPPEPEEVLVYPSMVWQGSSEAPYTMTKVPYSLYEKAEVGQVYTAWAGAPGTGYTKTKITRKDETGAYGYEIENTIQELHPCEVI